MKKTAQKVFAIYIILNLLLGFNKLVAKSEIETFSQEVKNLSAFAKAYGYVRFFYPNTQTENFDWDAFLIYGIKKLRNLKSDEELKTGLSELFSSIAPYAILSRNKNTALDVKSISQGDSITFWQHSSFSIGENMGAKSEGNDIKILVTAPFDSSKLIKVDNPLLTDTVQFEFIGYFNSNKYYHPDNFRYFEISDRYILEKQPDPSLPFSSQLTDNLWITMPITLSSSEAKHPTQQEEIKALSTILEEFYADKDAIFQADDVWFADFILTWNAIHHLYPYRKRSERIFEFKSAKQLIKGLEQISNSSDRKKDSYDVIRNYVSSFKDAHASVSRTRVSRENNQNDTKPKVKRSWLPFYRMYSQGKVYVLRSFDSKIQKGDEVLEIDNKKVSNLIDSVTNSSVGSLHQNLFGAVNVIGSLFNMSKGVVTLKRNGKILQVEVNTISTKEYFQYYRNPFNHDGFEYPNSNTIYINPSLASPEEIRKKLNEFVETEYLIVDLRSYPNSIRDIFEHLSVPDGFLKGLILSQPLNMYPNQQQQYHIWESPLTISKKPFINAKIFVLIGSSTSIGTMSRGETFASYFKYAGATLIGDSNSVGAAGGIDWFTTPGNTEIVLTISYTIRQKGEEMQSIGITPDILIQQTVEGLKEGRDLVYEAALKRTQQE